MKKRIKKYIIKYGEIINKFFKKIFFDLDMSYENTIIYAIITAFIVGILNVIPFLQGTSFVMPAETFEFWFVLALVIVLNCKNAKEAVIKTFLYFLISQPLIYLVEVPFNEKGFELFSYYGYWFKWTILTIPGSFIAYQVKRKNMLSAAILSIACGELLFYGVDGFLTMIEDFPTHMVSCIVCSFFGVYFIFLILKDKRERLLCGILSTIICIIFLIINAKSSVTTSNYIIDDEGKWHIVSSEVESKMIDSNDIDITVKRKGTYRIVLKNENNEEKTLVVVFNKDGLNIKEEF